MSHLVPCSECNRHVKVTEVECPFCGQPLALGDTSPPPLPRTRLGRAATFAFGATLVGVTTVVACGGDDTSPGDASAGASGSSGGSMGTGGTSAGTGGASAGTGGTTGATGGSSGAGGGTAGSGGKPSDSGVTGDTGGVQALYGAVPADL
jgi:hypothetical protein